MPIKNIFFVLSTLLFSDASKAQFSRYTIQLKDKTDSPFSISNPSQFLSLRAIDRRVRYNIAIDQNDLPVNAAYLDSISMAGDVTILNVSKWFNQVCIKTTDAAAIAKINALPFVMKSAPVAARPIQVLHPVNKQLDTGISIPLNPVLQRPTDPNNNYYDYGLAYPQIHLHNADFLHNLGFRGNGLQMAVTDAGFYNYHLLPTFDSIRNNHQILGTWDFVSNKISVSEESDHGMKCFSTIAANLPGKFVGTAPEASFYLFRTEDAGSEYPVEEQNWVAAAERADSLGVDLVSVSLGYYYFDNSSFNYRYADMDGGTTLIAKAVNMAAQKGLMVVVSAGNEGDRAWHYISTPGDADRAFTVGAVNVSRQPGSFSSYGPDSDGQVKPDAAAVGVGAVVANQVNGQPSYGGGTSYSCPIMSGVIACLWQAFPEINNSTLIDVLHESSDRSNTPDNRTGYGIPDAKKAFVLSLKKLYTQQISIDQNCIAKLSWTVKTAAGMNIVIERKLPADTNYVPVDTQSINANFSKQNFNFSDDLSASEPGITIRYRIKMNIGTDSSFYLDSATVQYTERCYSYKDSITVAPNPVRDMLTVFIKKPSSPVNVSVTVHNMSGQKVYQLINQPVNSSQVFSIPMKQLSSGLYYVTLWVNNKKQLVKKIVKL
jgi:serine protease AprX